jgi:hypothetical protein
MYNSYSGTAPGTSDGEMGMLRAVSRRETDANALDKGRAVPRDTVRTSPTCGAWTAAAVWAPRSTTVADSGARASLRRESGDSDGTVATGDTR